MGAALEIYSIYRHRGEDRHYLLRTLRPEYSNASQSEEDRAVTTEQENRARLLNTISPAGLELVGELQGYPVGDALSASNGNEELEIYYMETEFGHPWVVLGTAGSEGEFLSELHDDEDLLRLNPTGHPIKITVAFLTEVL